MKVLILPPLIINLMMFTIGLIMGFAPGLLVFSTPGGYVFQLQFSAFIFGMTSILISLSFIGVRILGSGLSDTTVMIINRAVAYSIIWTLLSTTTFAYLFGIPTFGSLIYTALSLFYGIGVFIEIASIGGGEAGSTGGRVSGADIGGA